LLSWVTDIKEYTLLLEDVKSSKWGNKLDTQKLKFCNLFPLSSFLFKF